MKNPNTLVKQLDTIDSARIWLWGAHQSIDQAAPNLPDAIAKLELAEKEIGYLLKKLRAEVVRRA